MSQRNFSLSTLIPEPLTFTDDAHGGDGAVHDVLTFDLLSETDLARLMKLERRMAAAFANSQGAEALQAINELIRVIIPTLPRERAEVIPLAYKTQFFTWWKDQQPAPGKATGATAAPPSPTPASRGKPSRASSRSTGSTRGGS